MSASSRRAVLVGGAGAAAAGVAGIAYAATTGPGADAAGSSATSPDDGVVAFRGPHQAGITTAAQDRMHFVALDVISDDPAELRDLLTRWTRAAERMTAGAEAAPGGTVGGGPWKVPEDTGEALDLAPGHLTVTIGYGPSLFDDRFGLADRRPEALRELPAFVGDDLDPARSGGDLCIQACSDDPQVAVHAVRNLVRMGFGVVSVRWSQLGFGRTSSTSRSQLTRGTSSGSRTARPTSPRRTPTGSPSTCGSRPTRFPGPPGGWRGAPTSWPEGSACTSRSGTAARSSTRSRPSGATSGSGRRSGRATSSTSPTSPRRASTASRDPLTSHVRLAHRSNLDGIRILRRGYTFTDGSDGQGHLDAGLFFIAFVRDAHRQFVPMQKALAGSDALNEYIEHTGSALFACPPGLAAAADWGTQLFA